MEVTRSTASLGRALVLVVKGTLSSVDQRSRVKEREEEKRRGGKRQAEGGEAVGVPFTANRAGWLAGWAGLAGWVLAGLNYLAIGLAGWAGLVATTYQSGWLAGLAGPLWELLIGILVTPTGPLWELSLTVNDQKGDPKWSPKRIRFGSFP